MSIVLDGTTGVTAPALTGFIDAANLTGALPAIDGSALTGLSGGNITLATPITFTGQTSVLFTGIPATAKRVTVMLDQAYNNIGSYPKFYLGTSAGIETSGYVCATSRILGTNASTTSSTGYFILNDLTYTPLSGTFTIEVTDGNTWIANGNFSMPNSNGTVWVSGSKTLAGTLDRIQYEATGGISSGTINISWEE